MTTIKADWGSLGKSQPVFLKFRNVSVSLLLERPLLQRHLLSSEKLPAAVRYDT